MAGLFLFVCLFPVSLTSDIHLVYMQIRLSPISVHSNRTSTLDPTMSLGVPGSEKEVRRLLTLALSFCFPKYYLPAMLRLELLFSKKVSSVNRHTHRNTAILQLRGQPRRKIHFTRNSPSCRKTRQTPMPLCFYFHKPPSRRARAGRRAGEFIERRMTLRSPRAVLGQARGQELSEHPVQILHLRSPIKL